MNIGNNLFEARKKSGYSQEEVAEQLGVSRQTISKWELNETIPDIYQSKKMAKLYDLTLDELIKFDVDLKEIEKVIEKTSEEQESKIDWTKGWGKKYPILIRYQKEVNTEEYAIKLRELLNSLKNKNNYNDLEALLVLEDILGKNWKDNKDN